MLKGKNALVTGSTSGIGLGIARALAAAGANVALNGIITPDEQAKLRETWSGDFHFFPANLLHADAAVALVKQVTVHLGSLDILVNNAGIQHVAPIDEFPPQKWDDILALNLSAAFHTIRSALPSMRTGGWGRIINVASVHGLVASVQKAAYVSAKHGLVGLTKVVALETAGSGVTCNAICPGFVYTPLIEKQVEVLAAGGLTYEQATIELLREKQPSRTFTTADQLGSLAAFLCSDAGSNLTGASLPVDGGWTAQ